MEGKRKLTLTLESDSVAKIMEALNDIAYVWLPGPETPGTEGTDEADTVEISWRWE